MRFIFGRGNQAGYGGQPLRSVVAEESAKVAIETGVVRGADEDLVVKARQPGLVGVATGALEILLPTDEGPDHLFVGDAGAQVPDPSGDVAGRSRPAEI